LFEEEQGGAGGFLVKVLYLKKAVHYYNIFFYSQD